MEKSKKVESKKVESKKVWVVELQRNVEYNELSYSELLEVWKKEGMPDNCDPYPNQIVGIFASHDDAYEHYKKAYDYCGFGYIPQIYQMKIK